MKWTLSLCVLAITCACSKESTSHARDTTSQTPPAQTPAPAAPMIPPTTTTPPVVAEPPPVTPPQPSDELLAGDQDAVDRALVQQVHQVLQADMTLSTEAKTITVKAQGGLVTLDGLVQSEEEKGNVEALVKAIPGVQRVENQLLVKTS